MKVELKNNPELKRIVGNISKKRACYIRAYTGAFTYMDGWDGGSKDEYWVVFSGGVVHSMAAYATLDPNRMGDPYRQRKVSPDTLPPGCLAIVRAGWFCGKPSTPCVYLPKDHKILQTIGSPGLTIGA